MKFPRTPFFASCCALGLAALPLRAADVVINEIMYQPAGFNPFEEYIEIYNRGTGAVNLAGWRFSKGVDYTFPSVNLAPGGYLVVPSHLSTFQAKYPGVLNVVGGWNSGATTNFALSNSGEDIELVDANGNGMDAVRYANEGDWGRRRLGPALSGTRGWEWSADHDGLGKSLELINPALSNNHGQNWAPSLTQHGTPGVVNSVRSTDIAPLILEVTHYPPIPRSTDPVTVSARILDELPLGAIVTLRWRNHTTTTPPAFSSTNMVDDGLHGDGLALDGVFAAVLPALPNGTVIEFYVEASDGDNTRTWPAPADVDGVLQQDANAQYQVDDTVDSGVQPVFRLIMTESQRLTFQNINRASDAQMNCTFIARDGTGTRIRYLCGTRIRGASSRTFNPPPTRLNVPQDNPWSGYSELNINSRYYHAQFIGSYLALKAGVTAAEGVIVEKRINGSGSAYVWLEPLGGEWAQIHFPDNAGGNFYRASTGNHNADLTYGPDQAYFESRGYSKASNTAENDWTDLIRLTDVLNNTPDATFNQQVDQVADMPQWMRYFAFMTMVASMETSIANGRGDDYSMYRGTTDPRFILLPHDLDTIIGEGDWGNDVTSASASIFRMVPVANAQVSGFGTPVVPILDRLFTNNTYVAIYYRELWRMLNTTFAPEQFNPMLDSLMADVVAQTVIDQMKSYQATRNASVRSQIPLSLTVSNLPPAVNGYPQTTSAALALNGGACPLDTLAVRVNGAPADWLAWRATWSIASVPLSPGLNRILVQALGSNNVEIARTTVDVWYDDGTTANRSGTLAGAVTWTAAGGPHTVTADVLVPAGASLTIQPGASVFFAPGTRLRVEGTLNATGTDTARIRFGRTPGVAGTWNGILISNAAAVAQFAYVDFDGADGGTENVRIVGSDAVFSHCSWTNTTRTILDFNNSVLVLSNSVLPAITAGDHVRGGPIPDGTTCVLVGNTFGVSSGTNDVIDISGGARPNAVLQVLDNVFTGASDDVLELDGVDAHVEGNAFLAVHKNNPATGDTANAIAVGRDNPPGGYASHVVAVRNVFHDVDHAALIRDGAYLTFVNNTVVGVGIAAFNFSEPERGTLPGLGARVDGNIVWNPPGFAGTNFQHRHPTNGTVSLSLARNLLTASDGVTNGVDGTLLLDPRLVNTTGIVASNIWDGFALRAGSPALGSAPNGLDRGAVVPAGASISGEPPALTHLGTATLTVGGPGISNYLYRVDGGAWSTERPVSQVISLSGLANGLHQVEVRGRNSAGVLQSTPTLSRPWTVNSALASLVFNEVLARNATALVVNGEAPDYLELQNRGGQVLDLGGMGITDDLEEPYKYTLPPGTLLEPGDYLLLYSDDAGVGLPDLGFQFNGDGDTLYLFNAPANGGGLVDTVTFGQQLPDLSIGRLPDGTWTLNVPTPGTANAATPTGDTSVLRINEWLADALAAYPSDFVEIFNPDTLPVDIAGLYLTDQLAGTPAQHQILPLTFVAPAGHLVFNADGRGGAHLNFRLAPERGAIALLTSGLAVIDCVFYEPQYTDVAQGRQPSGASAIAYLSTPTPGAPNPGPSGTTVSNFTTTLTFLRLSNTWRYEASGTNLGTAWRAPGFNDAAWPTGAGLLAFETPGVYAEPIRTVLPMTNVFNTLQITTYYFRATFTLSNDLTGFTLNGAANIDDGCVIYLNGNEVHRIRLTASPVLATSFGQNTTDGTTDTFTLPVSSLQQGLNTVAVEVHQATFNSSDVVFGLALSATRTVSVTNVSGVNVVLNEVLASPGTLTNSDGTITDWVELYNPTASAVSLADMSLSDSTSNPRRWVFPAGVGIPAGGTLVVRFDASAPPSTNNTAVLNTGFGLDNNGDALYFFNTPANGSALIDAVVFGVQASEFSIGRVPHGSGGWRLTQPSRGAANVAATLSGPSGLAFNEWLADPANGEEDWFELWNPNPAPVDISGLFLTDDSADRTRSPLPALSFLGVNTNGYARFYADNAPEQGANHVNFRLSKDGDFLGLYPAGTGPAVTAVTFGPQTSKVSQGRFPDGSTNLVSFPDSPSPAAANFLPLCDVVISEALTHTDPPFEDAIELQNLAATDLDISGWYLSDTDNDYRKFRIPAGTIVPAGGFKVFYETNFNPEPGRNSSFSLSSSQGDQIHLSTADTNGNLSGYRTSVKFGAAQNGESFGRYETSIGPDFPALSARSFGQDSPGTVEQFRTGTGLTNPYPRVGPVVVTEVFYHPPETISGTNITDNTIDEFIELQNIAATNVTLYHPGFPTNTWRLRDAVDYRFPGGISMPAGSRLLIVGFAPTNAALSNAFRIKYGVPAGVRLFGPWSGKLDNSSDSVELARPDAPQTAPSPDAGMVPFILVDKVKYGDAAPWPALADGNTNGLGSSLQRRVNANYGNDPVNWLAGTPTAGAGTGPAALVLPSISSQPANVIATLGGNASFAVTAAGDGPLSYQWRHNGKPIAGATNATLSLTALTTTNEGRYAVLVANPAGAVSSTEVTLRLQALPGILTQPQSQVVIGGSTVTFSVVAGGSPPLRYQWYKDAAALPGLTNASFSLTNVQEANEGGYHAIVTNQFGAATSLVATLTINTPPSISQQPQSLTVNAGDTAVFTVGATGDAPLRYQWRLNGGNITGETNATLTLPNVQGGSAGSYTVRITNAVGNVTSAPATLTVVLPPVITVSAPDPSAAEEGLNTGTFLITRSYATNTPITVHFTVGGSAGAGDYSPITSPVVIPANLASASVTVTPVDDATLELPETVTLTVQSGAGYAVGAPAAATVTIADNDNVLPVVQFTSPTNGQFYPTAPTNVLLTVDATDADGAVSKVEYFRQGLKLGESTSAPLFAFTWTNAPFGSNLLTAVATDGFGGASTSAPVAIVLNAPPTVSLTAPNNGASFLEPATINLTATASDLDGTVTQVEFFAGTNSLGIDTTSPYSLSWSNVTVGSYSLSARATDNSGAITVSTLAGVTVNTVPIMFTNNFTNRVTATAAPLTVLGNTTSYSTETGEPLQGNMVSRSGWLAWQAPASGTVVMDTFGSTNLNTVLAVYTGSVLASLVTVAFNNDAPGTTDSRVTFNATAGVVYSVQVGGLTGADTRGNIVLNILYSNAPPTITAQPQSRTVLAGAQVTFSVTATGTEPLLYAWRKDGTALPDATNSSLVLNNVTLANAGGYSVRVSNGQGAVTSAVAVLTVDDGLVVTFTTRLLGFTNAWAYDQNNVDLGTAWRLPGYNDAAWPVGAALFGSETTPAIYPEPFRTPLSLSNAAQPTATYYFRTGFLITNDAFSATLRTTNYLDDGAVWYVNGTEVARVRLPAGAITHATQATNQGAEGTAETWTVTPAPLVKGYNLLAVEVHQGQLPSSDVVFGMTLDATITYTNRPVILNPTVLPGGSFQATLAGIAGRSYTVEFAPTPTGPWGTLTNFNPFAGQAVFTDPAAAGNSPRFYRGRLVP